MRKQEILKDPAKRKVITRLQRKGTKISMSRLVVYRVKKKSGIIFGKKQLRCVCRSFKTQKEKTELICEIVFGKNQSPLSIYIYDLVIQIFC